ncbi:cytochrome c biogenesis protein CcsA [Paenibacillus beijingensis]|uniref:Cytochrome C assembly protein n=1 Tax=Paenibacillus beijingensis TaxID=1126833 RepID=A0A0D5NL98_9BACL|nr:cytochrome c biogenesis protein CcsA [Paenibacillus beijingensis]AJY76046.1 cytochrome C assembly protein [Paenibacillus beijingensis]
MFSKYWFYDAILYVYALSLLFYFSDFVDANRRAKRIGAGLLVFVWILQTGFLLVRIVSHFDMTLFSRFEYWFGVSWLLVTVSLVISRFFRIEFIVFLVNVIGFGVLALNLFTNPNAKVKPAAWETTRELLIVHISLITCSFAALTIGAVFSGMYLFLHRRLKFKKWSQTLLRLPSLELIDRYAFRWVLVGMPLLALSLSVAVALIVLEGRWNYLLDWKVISSFSALAMYCVYLIQRVLLERTGWQTAQWNLVCFAFLIVNSLINPMSKFHQ